MSGSCAWDPPGVLLNGLSCLPLPSPLSKLTHYPNSWHRLVHPPGRTHDCRLVDIGGGIGSTSMGLVKAFGHLRFVVQDWGVGFFFFFSFFFFPAFYFYWGRALWWKLN
ncbi:hypothetical protein PILCRDRAFT_308401 [Piloderma croceum F 1598]|uniref:O-methyltransferase domain-containing protein n=1 Tax=Piloderma croceum (strain F 1598) TaxID=765440 RepID=A0A0C3CA35_PILCF|nr:hypothetical protein PILCRDRAFT_308401 [Piloderma croceum F 1598]